MPAAITVEDGTGKADANSYVSLTEANNYFDTLPQTNTWASLTDDGKIRLVITAARCIDFGFDFKGFKSSATQAMQWPRQLARDRNLYSGAFARVGGVNNSDAYFPDDTIPNGIKTAQCEMARFILQDTARLDDAPGIGVKEFELPGALRVAFDSGNLRAIIPDFVGKILKDFGDVAGGKSGMVKLTRA